MKSDCWLESTPLSQMTQYFIGRTSAPFVLEETVNVSSLFAHATKSSNLSETLL